MAKLYILSGASGSGKTTLLNDCIAKYSSKSFVLAPKYSERPKRNSNDDIIHVDKINGDLFDIVYMLNGKRYAIQTAEISNLLSEGKNAIIIISDFRIIKELREEIGETNVITIYISSTISPVVLDKIHLERYKFSPDEMERKILSANFTRLVSATKIKQWNEVADIMLELIEEWKAVIPDGQSLVVRKEKIRLFHQQYINNIDIFDHVILNLSVGKPEEMMEQFSTLVNYYADDNNKYLKTTSNHIPRLFLVAAAPKSGKGVLMEALNEIGSRRIKIVTKKAKRDPHGQDRRDGMIAVGVNGGFGKDFDIRWTFHKGKHYKGTEYAISSQQIESNIQNNLHQIVITNMDQFDRLKALYPENSVFVYLHGLYNDLDIRKFQIENTANDNEAKQKILEIQHVYEQYKTSIHKFSHVILNTTNIEDLYDQMFNLIRSYNVH